MSDFDASRDAIPVRPSLAPPDAPAERPEPIVGPFDVTIDAHDVVTYAYAHNRVPIVRSLAIGLREGQPRGLLDVTVSVTWSREAKELDPEIWTVPLGRKR